MFFYIFFFKQKTAYELRISDWSSDVCSSDLMALEASFATGSLEHALKELVKLRASQINGCAFCIHMHTTDARKHGETEMRLYMLNAWRESTLYTDRERAALAWTEALTLEIGRAHV